MSDEATTLPAESPESTLPAPEHVRTSAPPPQPVTRIAGRYELLGLVGTGGMGSVYRARDLELGEIVALKVLPRAVLREPEALDRFRREVSLARKVTHRNVARTFDIGEHEGDRFLTMEFIEGESLGGLLDRQGALDLPTFLDIACEVCRGLEAAHAAGVIHLDLKPANVLVTKDGRPVISDFGIACAVGVGEACARGGRPRAVIAGTPAYMAPEQVMGGELDEAADIYALGAILFEMLTGATAWEGASVFAVASARLLRPPPDPRSRRPEIPEEVAAVIMRCMAREPATRFVSAGDVRNALETARLSRPSATLRAHRPHVAEATSRTVAVLPLRNRGNAEDEYLVDGFTEELIDAIAGSAGMHVRARGAVMSFKGTDRDPRDVGRLLGVEAVVEGSVRRASGMLHVSVRVIGVEDGYHLWARRFDVPERQLLRVTDEVAAAVARTLETSHDPRVRGADDSDEAAFDLFLRGRYELNKGSAELTRVAISLFERALTRLPNDPMILSAYAQAQFRRSAFDVDDQGIDEAAEIAERAARRALELAPTLGEARFALASLRLSVGDGPGAAQVLVEALRAGGSTVPVVQDLHGRLLSEVGSLDEALVHLRAAIAMDPSLERVLADVIRVHALLGRWDELSEFLAQSRAPQAVFWFLCARLSFWNPDTGWATELRKRIEPLEFPQQATAMRLLSVRLGEFDADEMAPSMLALAQRRGRSVRGPIFRRQMLAEVYLYAGRIDEAVVSIEKAAELGLMDARWLSHCPLLQKVASDTRLDAVRETVTQRARAVLSILESETARRP